VHPEPNILFDSVVKAVRLPRLCEENKRDCLAKVIQLESTRSHSVHDRRVVNDARRNLECPSSENDICMCGGATIMTRTKRD